MTLVLRQKQVRVELERKEEEEEKKIVRRSIVEIRRNFVVSLPLVTGHAN